MSFDIEGRSVGAGYPAFIIAELSANHLHDKELAKKTIKAMADSGADAVKLQTYTPDTITIDADTDYFKLNHGTLWDGRTLYDLYKEAYTPWEWQKELIEYAKDCGVIGFSSVFDNSSVDFLESAGVPAYKIASCEINDIPLIEYTASKGKPIIMSSGVATWEDLEEALAACYKVGNKQVAVLKCTSTYPAPLEEMNINAIKALQSRLGVEIGLSDHTLTSSVAAGAVALGACIIEKHFILDRSMGGPDSAFSMQPEEFKEMVKLVREVEKSLGEEEFRLTEEGEKSRVFSRSLFAVKDIAEGEEFNAENVRSIRPGHGLPPKYLKDILGKKATQSIQRGCPLTWSLIEESAQILK